MKKPLEDSVSVARSSWPQLHGLTDAAPAGASDLLHYGNPHLAVAVCSARSPGSKEARPRRTDLKLQTGKRMQEREREGEGSLSNKSWPHRTVMRVVWPSPVKGPQLSVESAKLRNTKQMDKASERGSAWRDKHKAAKQLDASHTLPPRHIKENPEGQVSEAEGCLHLQSLQQGLSAGLLWRWLREPHRGRVTACQVVAFPKRRSPEEKGREAEPSGAVKAGVQCS